MSRSRKKENITIKIERDYGERAPHIPEQEFSDKSKYNRKPKHKKKLEPDE